jgi:hypothetical protein
MKNVNHHSIRQCIVKSNEEFERDVKAAFGDNAYVIYADAGIMIYRANDTETTEDDECLMFDYIRDILSVYYDCYITSIHMDLTNCITVWLAYHR